MTLMEQEIFEQSETIKEAVLNNSQTTSKLAEELKKRNINNIVIVARGTSYHATVYFKYLVEVLTGLTVSFFAPSVVTLYGGKVNLANSLTLAVSQSGMAVDGQEVMKIAKKQGGMTASATNNCNSPLASLADFHFDLCCGEEKAVAATKTFTAEMAVLAAIAYAIKGTNELQDNLENIIKGVKAVLNNAIEIGQAGKKYKDQEDCFVLSRGMTYANALEQALKIQETSYIKAKAFAVSDFSHGPIAQIDEGTRVIMFAPKGKAFDDVKNMFERLKGLNADLTVFSDDEELVKAANVGISMPSIDEMFAPIVYAIAAQIFALNLSLARGLSPDAPRGLNKVTITK